MRVKSHRSLVQLHLSVREIWELFERIHGDQNRADVRLTQRTRSRMKSELGLMDWVTETCGHAHILQQVPFELSPEKLDQVWYRQSLMTDDVMQQY